MATHEALEFVTEMTASELHWIGLRLAYRLHLVCPNTPPARPRSEHMGPPPMLRPGSLRPVLACLSPVSNACRPWNSIPCVKRAVAMSKWCASERKQLQIMMGFGICKRVQLDGFLLFSILQVSHEEQSLSFLST
ncbi:hypothetical protein KC19_11G047300 [Ceratodon purpureus]|uniref:Uncharacterized protein n=1 Tax=Ceratodon purpureus TaxID=3225 RepID=A0A8T0GE25_CERPU|nr:hypothetical protein KC19_11G047300 [Ceratodon purpureus]